MNNTINGSAGMPLDTTMTRSNGYNNDAWASISPYSQSPYGNSPLNEYSNWNGYMSHSLPQETLNRMPPPLPQSSTHQMIQPAPPQMGHHGLPMLNTTWPSQLTNPTPSANYSAPPLSMNPLSIAQPVDAPRPPPGTSEKARKTLSTEQKRAMCQYYEENPGTRQADIGARFGVERSTVSKVLRQKDQYLKRDPDPEPASLRKGKGKHPDFDRTLSNYVRRQQQSGFEVKDDEIMDQAKLFARASGNQESLLNTLTSSWLQKFKQKHGIGGGRLMRRASEANIPDSARMSTSRKNEKPAAVITPTSPTGNLSPLSETRSDEDAQGEGYGFEFTYRQNASHSTTSLASDLRDAGGSSFSGSAMSPTGTLTFSPDPNLGGFQVDQNLQPLKQAPEYLQMKSKRSNTFPSLNIETVNQGLNAEPTTPRHPTSALESPAQDFTTAPFGIDTALTSPRTLHRSSSNSSINARSTNPASLDSSPVSPTPEDARRAANTLLSYIQSMSTNGQIDQSEYNALVQLTNKLKVHGFQTSRPSIGGLSRIPEGSDELSAVPEVAMGSS